MKTNAKDSDGRTDILLVDDNQADATKVINLLRKARIVNCVHLLPDGREVLQFLFRQGRFQGDPPLAAETLILLSLKLQSVSGIEVLRKIKSDERSRNFPVIVIATSQEDRGVMEAYKLGANAALIHPIDITKFMEAVAELRLGWLLITPEDYERA